MAVVLNQAAECRKKGLNERNEKIVRDLTGTILESLLKKLFCRLEGC